jgi:hypothetical protein
MKEMVVMPATEDEVEVAINIYTSYEEVVEDNVRELVLYSGDEGKFIDEGLVTEDGEITEDGWDTLNNDFRIFENGLVRWLEEQGIKVIKDGHDSTNLLMCRAYFDKDNLEEQREVVYGEFINDDEEVLRFPDHFTWEEMVNIQEGMSEFGKSVIDGQIIIYTDPLDEELT